MIRENIIVELKTGLRRKKKTEHQMGLFSFSAANALGEPVFKRLSENRV